MIVPRNIWGKLGCSLGRSPLAHFPVRVRGGIAAGARWTAFPYSAYWRGTHEPEVDAAIRRLGDLRGAACWDLGAHFGIYTVGLAMAIGSTGQVVGFEPDPVSFARLQLHVKMNGLHCVRLFNAAVSNHDGESALMMYGRFGTSSTHLAYPDETGNGAQKVPIQIVRLDSLVERGEIRIPRLIKIDVEGHGSKALRGAAATIRRALPAIIMAFHSAEEYEGARDLLRPLGYRLGHLCQAQDLDWPGQYPFDVADTFMLSSSAGL
jgi:FkbM family methyltransferase